MTARPIRRNAQTPDRNGKIFYTSTTSLSHISKNSGIIIKGLGELPKEKRNELLTALRSLAHAGGATVLNKIPAIVDGKSE